MRKWFYIWMAVNVADLATTLVCVSLGGGEGNLLLKGLVHSSVWGTVAYKLLVSAVIGLALVRLNLLGLLRICAIMVRLIAYTNSIWAIALARYSEVMVAGNGGHWGIVTVVMCIAGALAIHQVMWRKSICRP